MYSGRTAADGRRFADKLPNTTAEEILAGEFLLCQGIRFCFDVRHPFRALEGVILELRRLYPDEVRPSACARHSTPPPPQLLVYTAPNTRRTPASKKPTPAPATSSSSAPL